MRIFLCAIFAVVHAARMRPIPPNDVSASETSVVHPQNTPNDAVTLSQEAHNRVASLPQLENSEVPRERTIAQLQQTKRHLEFYSQFKAAREFEQVLQEVIVDIMAEAKARAKAVHDEVFHHGWNRAVKSKTAAVAAADKLEKALTIVLEKARLVGKEAVFRTLLKQTKLSRGATGKQLLNDIGGKVKHYLKVAEEQYQKYPKMSGLEAFREEMKAMQRRVIVGHRKPFDSEEMTKLSLGVLTAMSKSLYFEYKINHESILRVLQQDINQQMSTKMKSEVALDGFLRHISTIEGIFQGELEMSALNAHM